MKKIYPLPPVMAMSATMGLLYVLCGVLYALSPQRTMAFFNSWFHGIDFTLVMRTGPITVSAFIFGLVSVVVSTAVLTWIFVVVYNLCWDHCKNKGWIRE